MADEKHSWLIGERVYITVTAALGCFLGVALSPSASADDLAAGYGEFAAEAQAHHPGYQPETVNLDGWEGTQTAWQRLFPTVVVMRCFLHVVLGILQRCRSHKELYKALITALWGLFHSLNPAQFGQRLRRLLEWTAADADVSDVLWEKLAKLETHAQNFKLTFTHPEAYRTSNKCGPVDELPKIGSSMPCSIFMARPPPPSRDCAPWQCSGTSIPMGKKCRGEYPIPNPLLKINGFRVPQPLVEELAHCFFPQWATYR